MKSVLEIPVFATQEYFNELINSSGKKTVEKKYHDFSLFEYNLNDNYAIFFYLLNSIPEFGLGLLIDQVIPKAPFSLMVLNPVEQLDEVQSKATFISYHERYETPLHLCAAKDDSQGLEEFISSLDLESFGSKFLLFDINNKLSLNEIITEIIKIVVSDN